MQRPIKDPFWNAIVALIIIIALLAYVLSPIDLIPDIVPIFGFLDDIVAFVAGAGLAIKNIKEIFQVTKL